MSSLTKLPEPVIGDGERFGIIGAGAVAKALIFPLFEKGSLSPTSVYVSHGTEQELSPWRGRGCSTISTQYVTSLCDVVLWTLDPSDFPTVLTKGWNVSADKYTKSSSLHISAMLSISLDFFTKTLQENLEIYSRDAYELRTARAIVNLGSKVNAGCALVSILSSSTMEMDSEIVQGIFSATGTVIKVASETQGLACSVLLECGMGFIMPIVEAMCDGAVKAGAPRELSYRLTAAALKGAAEILLQDTSHPAVWKDRICTPGGPTIAGIEVMEEHAVRHAMMAAVAQAFKRSKELDQGLQ